MEKTALHIILGYDGGGIACKTAVQFFIVGAVSGTTTRGPVLIPCLQIFVLQLLCFVSALGVGLGVPPLTFICSDSVL